jgi:hypothetical protein
VTTAPAGLELDDLEPALLTDDEVGAGFTETTDSGDDDQLTSDELETSEECQEVIRTFEESDDDDDLQVEFEDAAEATLAHSLALIDEGEPSMAQAREAIGKCTIAWDDGQSQGEMRLSATEVDGPGDEAFEVEITIEGHRRPVHRHGGRLRHLRHARRRGVDRDRVRCHRSRDVRGRARRP